MTNFDDHVNLGYGTVTAAPSPSSTGVDFTLAGGPWPAPPFNLSVWPPATAPRSSNTEIIRVLAMTGGHVTSAIRGQEGTIGASVGNGWQAAASFTAKALQDVELVIITHENLLADRIGGIWFRQMADGGDQTAALIDAKRRSMAEGLPLVFPPGEAEIDQPIIEPGRSGETTRLHWIGMGDGQPTQKDADGEHAVTALIWQNTDPAAIMLDLNGVDGTNGTSNSDLRLQQQGARIQGISLIDGFWIATGGSQGQPGANTLLRVRNHNRARFREMAIHGGGLCVDINKGEGSGATSDGDASWLSFTDCIFGDGYTLLDYDSFGVAFSRCAFGRAARQVVADKRAESVSIPGGLMLVDCKFDANEVYTSLAAAALIGATTIQVSRPRYFKTGDVAKITQTGEKILIGTVNYSTGIITGCTRGYQGTTATALTSGWNIRNETFGILLGAARIGIRGCDWESTLGDTVAGVALSIGGRHSAMIRTTNSFSEFDATDINMIDFGRAIDIVNCSRFSIDRLKLKITPSSGADQYAVSVAQVNQEATIARSRIAWSNGPEGGEPTIGYSSAGTAVKRLTIRDWQGPAVRAF